MPILESDLIHRLSGGASNTNPNLSIGGVMSTDPGGVIVSDSDNNDMDDITSTEADAGIVIYHGYFYSNEVSSAPLTWTGPVFFVDSQTSSGDTGVDIAIAAEPKNSTIETLANEETAPSGGVSFERPVNKAGGIQIGDLLQFDFRGHWVKYQVEPGAVSTADQYTIKAEGDTLP